MKNWNWKLIGLYVVIGGVLYYLGYRGWKYYQCTSSYKQNPVGNSTCSFWTSSNGY